MTFTQVVETSVNVTTNSPSQDCTSPDDRNLPTYDMTPGFKQFTRLFMFYAALLHVHVCFLEYLLSYDTKASKYTWSCNKVFFNGNILG